MPPETSLKPLLRQGGGEGLGIFDDLLLVGLELRLQRLLEGHRLGGDDMHQRPALDAGEDVAVERLGKLFAAEDHAAARAAQGLVGGGGDKLGMGDRDWDGGRRPPGRQYAPYRP